MTRSSAGITKTAEVRGRIGPRAFVHPVRRGYLLVTPTPAPQIEEAKTRQVILDANPLEVW